MILQLLLLTFLTRQIGYLAMRKGVKAVVWKISAVIAWIVADIFGCFIAMFLFGRNEVAVFALGLICAFIGYSILKAFLEKKPDIPNTLEANKPASASGNE